MTIKQLIDQFLDGAEDGYTGSKSIPGNLKIKGDYLIHYYTVIAQRREGAEMIVNLSQYSIQTGSVQKKLKEALAGQNYVVVKRVPKDYCGDLSIYLK